MQCLKSYLTFINGGDDSDLNDHDKGLLGLMQNDFTSSIPSAALAASHLSIWKDGQAKNKLMQRQAANSGTTPHRRYTESAPFNAYPVELPPGIPYLAEAFIRIGIAEITVYELRTGALATFVAFRDDIVTESNRPVKTSADTAQNVRNGKSLTAAIRLAGSLQMLERAESDVDSILGDKALHSQQELVNFMIKVTARKKAEAPAMIPLRAFAMGSEFESLLPGQMYHEISEESARRALLIEARNQRIVSTLRGALSQPERTEAAPVRPRQAQEKPQDRLTEVVRYMVCSKFLLAAVPAIGALAQNKSIQLRVRSGKGANTGLTSELMLLADIQRTGLLEVLVRKKPGQVVSYFIRKFDYKELALLEHRLILAKGLACFGLTMDEYRANASTGSFDIDFAAIGAPLRTALPYGLLAIESGVFLPATTQRFLGPNKNNEDKSINFDDSKSCPLQPSVWSNTANLSDAANGKEGCFSGGVKEWKVGMESEEEDLIALPPQPTQAREGPDGYDENAEDDEHRDARLRVHSPN